MSRRHSRNRENHYRAVVQIILLDGGGMMPVSALPSGWNDLTHGLRKAIDTLLYEELIEFEYQTRTGRHINTPVHGAVPIVLKATTKGMKTPDWKRRQKQQDKLTITGVRKRSCKTPVFVHAKPTFVEGKDLDAD